MFTDSQIRNFLELSLVEAEKALNDGNYPIGSLVVDQNGEVISTQRNQCSNQNDVTAHAEVLNLREIGMSSPDNLSIFTSLEPCFGCSFFIARSKVVKIYSALKDPHKGGIGDLKSQAQFENFFADVELINEPFADLAEKSRNLMRDYFIKIGKLDKAKFYGYVG